MSKIFNLFDLDETIQILDTGASAIAEVPYYKRLMDLGYGHLNAFDGDERQIDAIIKAYSPNVSIFRNFVFDGSEQNVYLASPASGMTSLFKPDENSLNFFNLFDQLGKVYSVEKVQTSRLDDIAELPPIDLVKMDIQGAELTALKNGVEKLKDCLAVQLEVSFIQLYENQPSFGEVDVYMRSQGFLPHTFFDVKRWSIKPIVFNNEPRYPGNQLLEGDIVYVKELLHLDRLSLTALKKLIVISHYALKSVDLCGRCLRELMNRGEVGTNAIPDYINNFHGKF